MALDFIFMLTRQDQTVVDCLDVIERISARGLGHIGFKDVGVDPEVLGELHAAIRTTGATTYMEVVSESEESALTSARLARDLGVDCLLGGTAVQETLEILAGSAVEYYPFVGGPVGHPTQLEGDPDSVATECREVEAAGCAGVDLLAYRSVNAEPLEMVRAARDACEKKLIVAGSVDSAAQVSALSRLGVDAFTIGSAVFSGAIDPRAALLESQLAAVEAFLSAPGDGQAVDGPAQAAR